MHSKRPTGGCRGRAYWGYSFIHGVPDSVRFLSDGRLLNIKPREHFTFVWLLSADTLLACIVHRFLKGKRRAKISIALVPPAFSTQLLVHKTYRGVWNLKWMWQARKTGSYSYLTALYKHNGPPCPLLPHTAVSTEMLCSLQMGQSYSDRLNNRKITACVTPLQYGGALQSVNVSSHTPAGKNPSPRFYCSSAVRQIISQLSITSGPCIYSSMLSQVQPTLFHIVFPNVSETFESEEELWMCYDSKS